MDKKEQLNNIIQEAMEASPEFKQKIYYWTLKRRKNITSPWLLLNLKKALGPDRLLEMLQEVSIEQA